MGVLGGRGSGSLDGCFRGVREERFEGVRWIDGFCEQRRMFALLPGVWKARSRF